MKNGILGIVLLLLISHHGTARIIYLDPINGDNGNSGTLLEPLSSLESILVDNLIETQSWMPLPYSNQSSLVGKNIGAVIQPGDTLALLPGYHGNFYFRGATNQKPVTVLGWGDGEAILGNVRLVSGANWIFDGLTISGETVGQFSNYRLLFFESHGHHGPCSNIVVRNCKIQSIENSDAWSQDDWLTKSASGLYSNHSDVLFVDNILKNVDHGITITGSRGQILRNEVINFSGDGVRVLGNDMLVEDNLVMNCYNVDDNHDDGIQSWSTNGEVSNVTIRRNVIINFDDINQPFRGPLQGIGCFDGPYRNWKIENNLIITDHWHGISLYGAYDCSILHNTVIDPTPNVQPGPVWIRINDHKDGTPSSGCTVANNLCNNLVIGNQSDISNIQISSNNYDLYFEDWTLNDYRLRVTSPAVDSGDTQVSLLTDVFGNSRPSGDGPDIGAHEFQQRTTSQYDYPMYSPVIYPNPTAGLLFLEVNEVGRPYEQLLITDIDGKISTHEVNALGDGRYFIDLDGLPCGIFFLYTPEGDFIGKCSKF